MFYFLELWNLRFWDPSTHFWRKKQQQPTAKKNNKQQSPSFNTNSQNSPVPTFCVQFFRWKRRQIASWGASRKPKAKNKARKKKPKMTAGQGLSGAPDFFFGGGCWLVSGPWIFSVVDLLDFGLRFCGFIICLFWILYSWNCGKWL